MQEQMMFRDYKPGFYEAVSAPDPLAPRITEAYPGIYTFGMFSDSFCKKLLKEVDKHPSESPNSMNRYGVVLKDIGLGHLCQEILEDVVNPLVRRFYPSVGKLKRYHGFIVDYEKAKQGSLDRHYDDATVTLNVCLGRKFTGGDLVFTDDDGEKLALVKHKVGQAVLHLGSDMHQARSIRTGRRSNLILWCRR